jgi:hypothetical protein
MSESLPPPWERLPGEPGRWYARFERFRLAGPNRSLLGAVNAERAEAGRGKQGRVPGAWNEAARRWRWRERAAAWDESERRRAREHHATEVRDMRQRHAQEARALQAKAAQRLRALRPEELGPAELLRYFVEAAKLERLAVGEPDAAQDPGQPETGHVDLFARVEQYTDVLRQLRGAGGDAAAGPAGDAAGPAGDGGLPAGAVPGQRLRQPLAAAPPDGAAGTLPVPDVP